MDVSKVLQRKFVNGIFWIAAVVLAGNLSYRALRVHNQVVHAREFQRSLHPTPFTAVIEDLHYDSHGAEVAKHLQTWAVRSDGSRMLELASPNLNEASATATRFVDIATGQRIRLDLIHNTKSTTQYVNAFDNSWVRTPSSNCLDSLLGTPATSGQVLVGRVFVDGYETSHIKFGPMNWWFALQVGCAPVKTTIDEGVDGRNEQRLVSLTPGEPSSSLFVVPSSFREVNASTSVTIQQADPCRADGSNCRVSRDRLRELDDEYDAHQSIQ